MKKFFVLILIFLGLTVWISDPFFRLGEIKNTSIKITEITEKKIFTPPGLKSLKETEKFEDVLTQPGLIYWTNVQREKNDLLTLTENETLNLMAKNKINDMFKYQYFAHESLTGQQVGNIAEKFDYQFMAIGENLAMGNFSSDQDLIQAWMDSPGHRENILNKTYQEIGIAVEKGYFNEEMVWLAVQHFGLSATICSKPDEKTKLEIEKLKQEIKEFEEFLSDLSTEIKKTKPKWGVVYRKKVEEYNNLVEEYNEILSENKKLVEKYNEQVQEFNQCLSDLK